MTSSLGTCGAALGLGVCPGDVIVERVVGGIAEGQCSLCGLEYASPGGAKLDPEPEPDFLDEPGAWWKR